MIENDKKLDTSAYKGVRDFYPSDMWVQAYIFEVWSLVAESYGYERYDASVLEPADLFRVKSGEEIVREQTYTFTDKGKREVSLRPEMTPSVARMIAARQKELLFPLRWYSIPNIFRYERPQRGRLREHWQLNCDIFGVPGTDADIEIILLADAVMRGFAATRDMYTIHLNHMGALVEAFEELGVPKEKHIAIRKLLDQKNKSKTFEENLNEVLGVSSEDLEAKIKAAPSMQSLSRIVDALATFDITNVVIDPTIVRGQDYYTGVVFEVFDADPENNRSMFGGGRYDELMDLFGATAVPAVGFGMGDVTIRDFLLSHGLLPEQPPKVDLFIATLGPAYILPAEQLAERMREGGINVSVNLTEKKIGEQIALADKHNIPYLLVLGEDEMKSKRYTIKQLKTGEEKTLGESEITSHISSES